MINRKDMQDAALRAQIALPNAAATVVTPSIDLGKAAPGAELDHCDLVVVTEEATGVTAKEIDVTIQDSADDVTFAPVAAIGVQTIAAASSLYPASEYRFKLPPGIRRYIRASATGETGGGNASDGLLTIGLRF